MMSVTVLGFFEREVDQYLTDVRTGNIDPSDGFHPTVYSALDSIWQAPSEIREDWIGDEDNPEVIVESLITIGLLIAVDPERSLVSVIDEYVDLKPKHPPTGW